MVKQVYGIDGKKRGEIELSEEVFGAAVSNGSIYHALRNEAANRRVGTASTKGRSEVTGSGRKPWRQKGTGRARAGSFQSPLWAGGGVIFGPKPRDYSYRLPKKVKRLAIRSILSMKNREERLKVVEDFTVQSGKTRDLRAILRALEVDTPERTVIVHAEEDALLKRAGRNLPNVQFLAYRRLCAHDLFYGRSILVLEKAARGLNAMYGKAAGRSGKRSAGSEAT